MNRVEADNADALAQLLADEVAEKLTASIQSQGTASLVVSGGSTPVPFFAKLSAIELDWDKVVVSLADERWVHANHKDSNERLVQEHLMVGHAAAASFCSLYEPSAETAEAGVAAVAARVESQLARPLSVVVLGMGTDGHTASLFPDTYGLEQAMALDNASPVQIMRPEISPHARITMTRSLLLDSRHRYLHVTGQEKKMLLDTIDTPAGSRLPIAGFLEELPITVYWSS